METMQEKQARGEAALMREGMEKRFAQWLQENGYEEAAFLEKYREEELVKSSRGSIWRMTRAVRPRSFANFLQTGSGKAGI